MPFVLVETSRRRRRAFVTGPTRWSTGPASPRRAGQGPNRTDARHLVHRVMHSLSTIPRVSLWAVGGTVRVVILAGPTPLPSPAAPEHLHRLAATIRIALICGALAIIVPSGRPRACRGHTTSAPGKPSRPWLGYAATNVGQIREEGGPLTGSRYHHLPGCARLNVGHSAEAAGSSVHSAMSGSPTSSSGHCILADRVYFIVDNTKGPGSRAPSLTDVQKVADVVLASLLITAPPMHRMAACWRARVWRRGRRGRAAAAQGLTASLGSDSRARPGAAARGTPPADRAGLGMAARPLVRRVARRTSNTMVESLGPLRGGVDECSTLRYSVAQTGSRLGRRELRALGSCPPTRRRRPPWRTRPARHRADSRGGPR